MSRNETDSFGYPAFAVARFSDDSSPTGASRYGDSRVVLGRWKRSPYPGTYGCALAPCGVFSWAMSALGFVILAVVLIVILALIVVFVRRRRRGGGVIATKDKQ